MIGLSVLAAGAALGVRHALEADHLAAVAALVEGDADRAGRNGRSAGVGSAWRVGASWGVGHSLPIVALGLAFVALGVELPAVATTVAEAVVGVVLVVLGGRLLWTVVRGERISGGWLGHDHGSGPHAHLALGDLSLGVSHLHLDGDSFLVGVLHGFAGSGALVVLLVAAAPSTGAAFGLLAAFCALSIATMAAVSALWGRALGRAPTRYLEATAGLFGVVVGASLLAGQIVATGVA